MKLVHEGTKQVHTDMEATPINRTNFNFCSLCNDWYLPVAPLTLTEQRKERVAELLKKAALLLIDAQLEMLMDTPAVYEYELSNRLSPELYALYMATQSAEGAVVTAQERIK